MTFKVVGETFTYQAEGTYLIIPLEVTNMGEEQSLFTGDLLQLTYDGGEVAPRAEDGAQFAYIYEETSELLYYDPFAAGQTRSTFVLFDIPNGAIGLELRLQVPDEPTAAVIDLQR
jgi:hypothetical protein